MFCCENCTEWEMPGHNDHVFFYCLLHDLFFDEDGFIVLRDDQLINNEVE